MSGVGVGGGSDGGLVLIPMEAALSRQFDPAFGNQVFLALSYWHFCLSLPLRTVLLGELFPLMWMSG